VMDNPPKFNPCTGFLYVRASPLTLDLTNINKYKSQFSEATGDQEYILKNFLETGSLKYKQLPMKEFPNGSYLYNIIRTKVQLWWSRETEPYIVHMNFVVGGKQKLLKHQEFGTLFYRPTRDILI